jgi:hypothetical protein
VPPQQAECLLDLVNDGLRFGAHLLGSDLIPAI